MKLHLPKMLASALASAHALATPFGITLGTGAVAGWAAISTSARAETTVEYVPGGTMSLAGDTTITKVNGDHATIEGNNHSLKLVASEAGTKVENFPVLRNIGNLELAQGRFRINDYSDGNSRLSGVSGMIDLTGAQLWFTAAAYTGDKKVTNNISITGSTFSENIGNLDYSALRIGTNVEMSGDLTVKAPLVTNNGNRVAKIAFQGSSTLTLSGKLIGSNQLLLSSYDNSNTFIMSGDNSGFSGLLKFDTGGVTVRGGSTGLYFGGLQSDASNKGSIGAVSGVDSVNLTLNVDGDGTSYSYAGTLGGKVVLIKNGAGTQTLTNASTIKKLDLQAGTLEVRGSSANLTVKELAKADEANLNLTGNASLTLGTSDGRIDEFLGTIGGDGTGRLHLNMTQETGWGTDKLIVLGEGSSLAGVYLDSGYLAISTSSNSNADPTYKNTATNLRQIGLHMADGTSLIVTNADSTAEGIGDIHITGTGGIFQHGGSSVTFGQDFLREEGAGSSILKTHAGSDNGGTVTISGNVALDSIKAEKGTLNLGGTIRLKDGFEITGGTVNVTGTATIDLTDWSVEFNGNGGYAYKIGTGVNIDTGATWSLGGGTYDKTSGFYTVTSYTVTGNSNFCWGSADARDDNNQTIPTDSIVCFAGDTYINMAGNVSVQRMEIAEGANVTYLANQKTLSVKEKLLLNGSLSLLGPGGSFNNGNGGKIQFVVGENGKLIVDWGGKNSSGEVTSANRGTDHALLADYHGDLIVKNGASCLTSGERTFKSVTVESGGQFGINGTHTGDIIISGNGTAEIRDIQLDYLGALKFSKKDGDGSVLNGNVYVRGGSAAISSWNEEKGKITGTITGEDGHSTITILNGNRVESNGNVIKVSGGLRGISVVNVQQGKLQLLGGNDDRGTIESFGDTFTKRGAGTLMIAKAGAMDGGHFVIEEGTVSLGSGSNTGTAILKRTGVTVKGGASLILEHDALGWSDDSSTITKSLTLQGESTTERAQLYNKDNGTNTLQTVINMNGHSRFENASGSTGSVNTLSGFALSATGTDNEIATEIQVRFGFEVAITGVDSELTISGKIATHSEGNGGGLTKTGGGTLILTNAGNVVDREIAIHGGTLKLKGAGVKHGNGILSMQKDTNVEVAAGTGCETTLTNSITGRGNLKVSSGTLTLGGTDAVSLDNIYVSSGASMIIAGTKTTDSTTGTGGVNVMGTIYSDGVITVNGAVIMDNADQLAGDNFSDGENGKYTGGTVYVVQGTNVDTAKADRLGGTGTITIGSDTFEVSSISTESDVTLNNFTWDHTKGVLTYNDQSGTGSHDADAYYINVGTVTYGAEDNTSSGSDTTKLILDGGTLKITSDAELDKKVEAKSASTLYIDEGAEVNRSSIREGWSNVRLAGNGTYTISNEESAAVEVNLEGDWLGTVKLLNVTGNDLNLNGYGARLELSGLFKEKMSTDTYGYLKTGITEFTSNICLTAANNGGAAIYLRNGNNDDCYTFSGKISGAGDIVRDNAAGQTKTLKFTGDVSDWTGKFDSAFDNNAANFKTLIEFSGNATTINASVTSSGDSLVNVTINNDASVTMKGEIELAATTANLNGTLTLQGDGTKSFTNTVTAGNIAISGGAVTFNNNLTVTDRTTLTNSVLTIADDATYTTGNETITKLTAGTDTTISGTGIVSVATAGITYTNADITVNTADMLTTAATLAGSRLTVTGGGSVKTEVAQDSTNSFDASQGNVTVDTGSATIAKVEDLTVGAGKEATFATENGAAADVVVSGTADVAGSVSADVTVQSGDAAAPATFTANNGAEVGGSLTVTNTGTLVINGVQTENNTALNVDGAMTLQANSVLDFTALGIEQKTGEQTFVIAIAQSFSISENTIVRGLGDNLSWRLTNNAGAELLSSTTSSGGTNPAAPAMFSMRSATDTLTLTVLGTDTPGTLTKTSVVDGGVSVEGTNITLTVADSLAGVTGNFNVIVGEDAWKAIVDGMADNGGIYQNANVTLTDGTNTFDWASATGPVTLNGYAGTGTKGEYFVAYIPEPATATLSLLALAALAARRRRK